MPLFDSHQFSQQTCEFRHPERVSHREGTLGIDNGRENARQLFELTVAGETGFLLAQHLVHVIRDGPSLQPQPERLRTGGRQKRRHQLGIKKLTGARLDPLANVVDMHQQGAIAIVGRRQRINPIDQKDEVGMPDDGSGQSAHVLKLMPMGMVIADGVGQRGQGRKILEQCIPDFAMQLG